MGSVCMGADMTKARTLSIRACQVTMALSLLGCSAVDSTAASDGALGSGGSNGSGGTGGTGAETAVMTGGTAGGSGGGLVIPDDEEPPSNDDVCSVAILGDPGSNPSANFAAWLGERGPVVERFESVTALPALTAAELSRFDVVFLDWLAPDTSVGISPSDLGSWVMAGGRLVALSGYGDYPEALAVQNDLLLPLSVGFDTTGPIWGPVTQFVPHSITTGLTSLTFIGGRSISHLPDDEVLMTVGDPADAVCVIGQRGSGKVFLFGDEWITYDSEWSAEPEIEQFWVNVFSWLGDCDITPIVK